MLFRYPFSIHTLSKARTGSDRWKISFIFPILKCGFLFSFRWAAWNSALGMALDRHSRLT